jgi:prevent-host-death family protein
MIDSTMKKIHASAFKAHCLAVMKKVQATGEPVIVTKRGAPLVKVVPVEAAEGELFGFMAGDFEIVGDVESPVLPPSAWKITRK